MSHRKRMREPGFPAKIVGWLNVWDVYGENVENHLTEGRRALPVFHPYFCVLRQDLKTLRCHRSEQDADNIPGLVPLTVWRLDDGKRQFDQRWGYETLEDIRENADRHARHVSTERLYRGKLDTSFNESLPDLSHSYDSTHEIYPKKRHVFKKFFHTSYEKLVGDKDIRRGSVPAVPAAVDEDTAMMETTSTPSRFTSFLVRKGFKSNLKRTKSSSKLDRKRAATSTPQDADSSSFVGTLKRTMSLGRLTRKRTRSKTTDTSHHHLHTHQPLSVISSRLKSSQSHESLLTCGPSPMHSIDLTTADMEIKPLHSSILNQEHCFQVATTHGSKYISCRTAEERQQWIQSLRKTVNPQQENTRRSESSIKIWVQEAKSIPSKKRYFCEICLDKHLCARTSVKMKGDMLFWGEQFEFNNLPSIEFLIVNLYREADKKKKKDRNTLVGYAKIPISEISNRQYVEKWFATSSGTVGKGGKENKTDLPLMRLKVRHQTVQILPVNLYKDLSQYLRENYTVLCDVLEPLVNIKDKEEIATTLVNIMQKLGIAKQFLSEVIMTEVLRLDNNHLTFRGNSIATKAMEAHMKLVGKKYLNDTLGDFVRTIIDTDEDCEVDPTRVAMPTMLPRNQDNLKMYCDMAWTKIITSSSFFPSELHAVFSCFRDRCQEAGKGDLSDKLISASIFLRFLCPAILSPSLFHLTQEFPSEKGARNLTLIAKTIQTLANMSRFGSKEEYMTFMNSFVEEEGCHMEEFLHTISSEGSSENLTEFDGDIDLGKEMSILHALLMDTLERATQDATEKLCKLPKILSQITNDLKDPNIHQRKQNNRRSQHYDNLVNIQAHIDHTTPPTELLRDMLQQCGDSPDNLPMFNGNGKTENSQKEITDTVSGEISDDLEHSKTNTAVSNVSASSRLVSSEVRVNQSWNQMVSAAEIVNGEYIDLISFMDEEVNDSSMEMEQTGTGSQMSISQVSTIASSGYQSFGYSQSSSPVDNNNHEVPHDTPKSPNNNSTVSRSTPLSFSNPMYRHNHRGVSSRINTSSPIPQASSSSSLSSEEANTIKNFSPVKSERTEPSYTPSDPLRRMAPRLSSSSSTESMQERERMHHSWSSNNMSSSVSSVEPIRPPRHSQSNNNVHSMTSEVHHSHRHSQSNNNVCASSKDSSLDSPKPSVKARKNALELRVSSPLLSQSAHKKPAPNYANHCNTIGSTSRRNHELSQSVDFSYMTQRSGNQLRRAATDTKISQRASSPTRDSPVSTPSRGSITPDDSSSLFRRLSAQNAVHMGIRSVQRRIHEQDKTKQEYETEVNVLKQQLQEAQNRLRQAEDRLTEHESSSHEVASEWQCRLEESEEQMRKQQAEKDDQMKNIIQRLIHVEDELREEQEEMSKIVQHKQKVIEAQERRIHSLDVANNKLVVALNQLKEHYNLTTRNNGIVQPLKTNIADVTQFKTSSC